jgi:hypothetical protein
MGVFTHKSHSTFQPLFSPYIPPHLYAHSVMADADHRHANPSMADVVSG